MTDIPENLTHLMETFASNKAIIRSSVVSAAAIRFGNLPDIQNFLDTHGAPDVILGADIGFDLALHTDIAETLKMLVKNGSTIILCEEIRWADIFNWYVEELSLHFHVETLFDPVLSGYEMKLIRLLRLTDIKKKVSS